VQLIKYLTDLQLASDAEMHGYFKWVAHGRYTDSMGSNILEKAIEK